MLTLEPIGHVRSPHAELADAPRQPHAARGVAGQIELVADRNLDDAVADLEGWEYIWVLFWFHRAGGYRPKVLPPRSKGKRRGVLATRSPHRPNPLGLSVVRLEAVRGLVLDIRDVDMIDGTPVLDIKPYVPWADIVPASAPGWLQPLEAAADAGRDGSIPLAPPADPEPGYCVRWEPLAEEQLAFIAAHGGGDLRPPLTQRLSLGPQPHAYRRIRVLGDKREIAYKAWRFGFRVEGRTVVVERASSGYRPRELASGEGDEIELHQRFVDRFGAPARR